jgi:ankyrin repeat protein
MLLNATDYEGNTPLHLAVKYGFPRIVSTLLRNMTVEIGIANKDGLSVQDLANRAITPARWCYFLVSLSDPFENLAFSLDGSCTLYMWCC